MTASQNKWLSTARAFVVDHLLTGVVLVALTGAAAGWLKGFAGDLLPGSEASRCWIEQRWQAAFGGPPDPSPGQFVVLVTRLANDRNDTQTEYLKRALRGEEGFLRLETCRVVTGHGASLNAIDRNAEEEAERLRIAAGADLVLFGDVADRGALHVWMTGPTVRPNLKAKAWV